MDEKNPDNYCFLARKSLPCIKTKVAKRHLPYYECEKCIWRIHSENDRHLNSLQKMFEKYAEKEWE